MNTPVYGCDGCRGTLGAAGCPTHGRVTYGPTEQLGLILHRHVWSYRGDTSDGLLVMVCDQHDPPRVRLLLRPLIEGADHAD